MNQEERRTTEHDRFWTKLIIPVKKTEQFCNVGMGQLDTISTVWTKEVK